MKKNRQYRNDLKDQSAIIFKMNAVHRDLKKDSLQDVFNDLFKELRKIDKSIKPAHSVPSFSKGGFYCPAPNANLGKEERIINQPPYYELQQHLAYNHKIWLKEYQLLEIIKIIKDKNY